MQKAILLAIGIADLTISYLAFTSQQYFSILSMLSLFLLAFLAAFLFVFPHTKVFDRMKNKQALSVAFVVLSFALAYYAISFDHPPPNIFSTAIVSITLITLSTAVSIIGLYAIAYVAKGMKHVDMYVVSIIGVIIVSTLAYMVMYGFHTINWNGYDENAFNYYAAYLFAHGANPYTQSMEPIITQRGISPTLQLNGTFEYEYDYPALSFLPYLPLIWLGIESFYSFVAVVIFICILASFLIYYKSGFNNLTLLPIAVWLMASFALVGVANSYLAISAFLLFAYLQRHRPLVCGVLLGLAASVTQLAWFALPFFYILLLKQHGKSAFAKVAMVSIVTFLVVNSYFLIISPIATTRNIFALFGLTKLPLLGENIMQFFAAFYPVPYWYSLFLSALVIIGLIVAFSTYNIKPILAIAPATIFFFSWRNISIYGLPYIPLLLAIYYAKGGNEHGFGKAGTSKQWLLACIAFILIAAVLVAVYAHGIYLKTSPFRINTVMPVIFVDSLAGTYSLAALNINVTNNNNLQQVVTFYVISRSPNYESYTLGPTLGLLNASSSRTYVINYQLPMVNNNTRIVIFAFSTDYTASKQLNLAINPPH